MVAYLVCIDLAASFDEQTDQLKYWLDFLSSALPLSSNTTPQNSKWTIIVVGLRSDCQPPQSPKFQQVHINSWQKQWPKLPIFHQMFQVSSISRVGRVEELIQALEVQCRRILSNTTSKIPKIYRQVLQSFQSYPDEMIVTKTDVYNKHSCGTSPEIFSHILQYLNSIGRIVIMNNGMVFTSPTLAPKIAAKFISPETVRLQLLKKQSAEVQILNSDEIGCILDINVTDDRYHTQTYFAFLFCIF